MQTSVGVEPAATGRIGLVSRLLVGALPSVSTPGRATTVLDCGGGSGAYAVPLARAGAAVTVLDLSADALTTLQRRAAEAGVSDVVSALPGDVENLSDLVAAGSYDVVLAHGILDAVEHVEDTVTAIAAAVRPGGLVSLLVANPNASVIARALAGDPALALLELRALAAGGGTGAGPDALVPLVERLGLVVEARHGIGVFSDLVPGAALDAPAAREALAALDHEAAARAPFADIAGRIHLLVRRPAA